MTKKIALLMGAGFFSLFILFLFIFKDDFFWENNEKYFTYNQLNKEAVVIDPKQESIVLPEEFEDDQSWEYNVYNYIIRGFFENFNSKNNLITLKAEIGNRKVYREIGAQITNETIVSCWPEYLYDTVNKQNIPTHSLTFQLNDPSDLLFIKQEKILNDYDYKEISKDNYLIIQLKDKVNTVEINQIKKLIIIGSC